MIKSTKFQERFKPEALGQFIPPPRDVLPVLPSCESVR